MFSTLSLLPALVPYLFRSGVGSPSGTSALRNEHMPCRCAHFRHCHSVVSGRFNQGFHGNGSRVQGRLRDPFRFLISSQIHGSLRRSKGEPAEETASTTSRSS